MYRKRLGRLFKLMKWCGRNHVEQADHTSFADFTQMDKTKKQFLVSEWTVELVLELVQGCLAALQDAMAVPDDDDDLGDLEKQRHELNARPVPTSVPSVAMSARMARLEQYATFGIYNCHLLSLSFK